MIRHLSSMTLIYLIILLTGCQPGQSREESDEPDQAVIEVVTELMDFQLPDTIQSGWNTFRYLNNSDVAHFFIFEKLPEGIRLDNYQAELVPVFKNALNLIKAEKFEEAIKEFENIPAWFSEVTYGGGVGLLSPNLAAESTIYLEPGVYAMECYIRMPDGQPHAFLGMLKEVVVIPENTGNEPPTADHRITVSTAEGIRFQDSVAAGNHIFEVRFEDQQQYEHFLGHDVNLVRLEDPALAGTLDQWINATIPQSLSTPVPEGLTFLGGVQDLTAGSSGFFSVSLSPGNYALVAEVPNAGERKMLTTFIVTD